MSIQKPYLIFDAGGTIVYPNPKFLLDLAQQNGGTHITQDALFTEHCRLIYQMDATARETGELPHPWPEGYVRTLFGNLGIKNGKGLDRAVKAAAAYDLAYNLWAYPFSWSRQALEALSNQGYRMSVISNADGRVNQLLKAVQLDMFFEQIFDSKILGVEKPSPKIFEIALETLSLLPEEAIYIGDVFYVDVWGANQVGLRGIHLDPLNLYEGWSGVHLPDVAELPRWLMTYNSTPEDHDLMPVIGQPLVY